MYIQSYKMFQFFLIHNNLNDLRNNCYLSFTLLDVLVQAHR